MKCWSTKSGHKIYRILGGRCNSFLISNGHKYLLIDTGRENRWKALKNRLDMMGVEKSSLMALILTHAHFDHAENAYSIKKHYDTKIIVHINDGKFLQNGDNPAIYGTNPLTGFLTGMANERLYKFARYTPVDYDFGVEDCFSLKEMGFDAYVIHTPGHTDGSISIIVDDEIAVVGDTMFGVFPSSVFPPFGSNPKSMVESWRKLLDTNCSVFLPAHGTEDSRELFEREYERYRVKFKL